jgi:hypothetical protein
MKINKRTALLWLFIPAFFGGCVSEDEVSRLSEKPVSEIFENMKKLPAIEDPDPVIEALEYDEIFGKAYSMGALIDVSSEDPMPLYLKNMLKEIGEQVRDLNPEVKEKFKNTTLNSLVRILDPRVPLDPQLEQLLKELLEKHQSDLSLLEVPVVEGLEELRTAVGSLSQKTSRMAAPGDNRVDDSCAQAIFLQYGSGARACGLDLNLALETIESNYLRRMYEAELRLEERNELLMAFELERLPVVVENFRKVLTAIRNTGTADEVEEIRANIGYLTAAYAYHLRLNVPLWRQYGVRLIEWYYYKELELIEEIRIQKEAEAELAHQHCIDWVNGLIIEEVNKACPGDEPILY